MADLRVVVRGFRIRVFFKVFGVKSNVDGKRKNEKSMKESS